MNVCRRGCRTVASSSRRWGLAWAAMVARARACVRVWGGCQRGGGGTLLRAELSAAAAKAHAAVAAAAHTALSRSTAAARARFAAAARDARAAADEASSAAAAAAGDLSGAGGGAAACAAVTGAAATGAAAEFEGSLQRLMEEVEAAFESEASRWGAGRWERADRHDYRAESRQLKLRL